MGYVQQYKILSQGVEGKFYSVRIKAVVSTGKIKFDNLMALKNLISRKRSPRVISVIQSPEVSGFEASERVLKGAIEELANKIGLDLRTDSGVEEVIRQRLKRSVLSGDTEQVKIIKSRLSRSCDFYISSAVNGRYIGTRKILNKDLHIFSLGFDLAAYRSDDHSMLARIRIPESEFSSVKVEKGAAFEEITLKVFHELYPTDNAYLKQYKVLKNRSLVALVNKILSEWITELDLGRKILLSFMKIDNKTYSKLAQALNAHKDIAWADRGEYDRIGESFITVETRLNGGQLSDIMTKELGEAWLLDRQTPRRLDFISDEKAAALDGEILGEMPTWAWAIIGAMAVLIVLVILKKK